MKWDEMLHLYEDISWVFLLCVIIKYIIEKDSDSTISTNSKFFCNWFFIADKLRLAVSRGEDDDEASPYIISNPNYIQILDSVKM